MKLTLLISSILIIGTVLFLTCCKGKKPEQTGTNKNAESKQVKENPYIGLRQMALEATSEQLGLTSLSNNEVYGVVMDWDLGNGIMTLITYQTGDASMYLSTGGGVIGGGQHESVSNASKQFVKMASNYFDNAENIDSIPLPDKECVQFYFLTTKGKYIIQEKMTNIENKSSFLFDYFEEANKVISELRITTENR